MASEVEISAHLLDARGGFAEAAGGGHQKVGDESRERRCASVDCGHVDEEAEQQLQDTCVQREPCMLCARMCQDLGIKTLKSEGLMSASTSKSGRRRG